MRSSSLSNNRKPTRPVLIPLRFCSELLLVLICSLLYLQPAAVSVSAQDTTGSTTSSSSQYEALTDDNILRAVKDWRERRNEALQRYGPIETWDTSLVTDMSHLFNNARDFDEDISAWDTSRVTDMSFMFRNAQSFTGNKGGVNGRIWQTGNVTNMRSMFSAAVKMTDGEGLGLSFWKVSSVTSMNRMFQDAHSFQGDVSNFDVSNVEDFTSMFQEANALTTALLDFSQWDVSQAIAMDYMFYGTEQLKADICFGSKLPLRVTTYQMFCCSQSQLAGPCLEGHPRQQEIVNDSQECAYSGRTCGIRDLKERKIVITTLSLVMAISFLFLIWKYIPTTYIYERSMVCVRVLTCKELPTAIITSSERPLDESSEGADGTERTTSNQAGVSAAEELEARC